MAGDSLHFAELVKLGKFYGVNLSHEDVGAIFKDVDMCQARDEGIVALVRDYCEKKKLDKGKKNL